MVTINFICVNTLYVAVISVYDAYFARYRIFCLGKKPEATPAPVNEDGEHPTYTMRFFENRYFPVILKLRIPLTLLFVGLFALYIYSGAQLLPDPDLPAFLPESDPYQGWDDSMVEHFAFDNPYRFDAKLVFGIDSETPLNRDGTDPADRRDRGKVNFLEAVTNDVQWVALQDWLTNEEVTKPLGICPELLRMSEKEDNALKVARSTTLKGAPAVVCPWMHFKKWCRANLGMQCPAWPIPTYLQLVNTMIAYFIAPDVEDLEVTNYYRWFNNLFWLNDENNRPTPVFFTVDVQLSAQINMVYEDGLKLYDKWDEWTEQKRPTLPSAFRKAYFTGNGAFHYFLFQQTIAKECMQGIILSLALAYVVLLLATRNVVVASMAIVCVSSIVCSTIAFAWWNGWKLGMMEAIVFVMVIGLSVDYVVHLADAYLESPHHDRASRSRFMLGKMGMSIVSGATTTLGSSFVLTFTYITFFTKFGFVILFCIFQSLITSLIFFPAIMSLVGPQGSFGQVRLPQRCREICARPPRPAAEGPVAVHSEMCETTPPVDQGCFQEPEVERHWNVRSL